MSIYNNAKVEGNAELYLSKDRCNFKEVLDDLNDSQSIYITTYNINFDLVRTLNKEASIKLVLSIPNVSNVSWYLRELKKIRTEFSNIDTYINLDNHAKIICGDTSAYIGSANFTKHSSDNIECGLIMKTNLNKVIEFVGEIINDSLEYNGQSIKIMRINVIKKMVETAKDKLNKSSNYITEIIKSVKDVKTHKDVNDFDTSYVEVESLYTIKKALEEIEDVFHESGNNGVIIDGLEEEDIEQASCLIDTCIERYKILINFDAIEKRDSIYRTEDADAIEDWQHSIAMENSIKATEYIIEDYCDNLIKSLEELHSLIEGSIKPNIEYVYSEMESNESDVDSYETNKENKTYAKGIKEEIHKNI